MNKQMTKETKAKNKKIMPLTSAFVRSKKLNLNNSNYYLNNKKK